MKRHCIGHVTAKRRIRQPTGVSWSSRGPLAFVFAIAASVVWSSLCYAQVFGTRVEATGCASAIGGNITASNISVVCGIPPEKVDELVRDAKRPLEELTAQQRENIGLLKEKLDLNERQVRAALSILGENDIPPERLAAKLVEIAERFKALQATASAQPSDSPTIVSLRAEAQKAIETGDLAKADTLLATVEAEERRALDRLAVNAAATAARRGEIALTRLKYDEAAKHFASAASVFPAKGAHEHERLGYLRSEIYALYWQGDERGDNGALTLAIERCRGLLELSTRARVPLEWAQTQNNLGNALFRLGERESGTTRLEQAVAAYRAALEETTRERVPLVWAMTQNNLGNALSRLGQRESGTARLEQAVAAYSAALKERTRERVPRDWAQTQTNLGLTLSTLGQRESGTARLEQAVVAFRAALEERTRERVPLDWATSFGSQGLALMRLAERTNNAAMAQTALTQIESAIETLRVGGDAPSAAFYDARLPDARRIRDALKTPKSG
jgi:tetratricopeptide (TPR) repeat protein